MVAKKRCPVPAPETGRDESPRPNLKRLRRGTKDQAAVDIVEQPWMGLGAKATGSSNIIEDGKEEPKESVFRYNGPSTKDTQQSQVKVARPPRNSVSNTPAPAKNLTIPRSRGRPSKAATDDRQRKLELSGKLQSTSSDAVQPQQVGSSDASRKLFGTIPQVGVDKPTSIKKDQRLESVKEPQKVQTSMKEFLKSKRAETIAVGGAEDPVVVEDGGHASQLTESPEFEVPETKVPVQSRYVDQGIPPLSEGQSSASIYESLLNKPNKTSLGLAPAQSTGTSQSSDHLLESLRRRGTLPETSQSTKAAQTKAPQINDQISQIYENLSDMPQADREAVVNSMTEEDRQRLDDYEQQLFKSRFKAPAETLPAVPIPGIKNLGDTCYASSTLQLLAASQIFRDTLPEIKKIPQDLGKLSHSLEKVLQKLHLGGAATVNPHELLETFQDAKGGARWHGQQDAEEFLRRLLALLDDESKLTGVSEEIRARLLEGLEGKISESLCCTECGRESPSMRRFLGLLSIELPVATVVDADAPSSIDLAQCVEKTFRQRPVIGYTCEDCGATCVESGEIRNASMPGSAGATADPKSSADEHDGRDSGSKREAESAPMEVESSLEFASCPVEQMPANRAVTSENEQNRPAIEQRLALELQPRMLIVHLQRNAWDSGLQSKLHAHVSFPQELNGSALPSGGDVKAAKTYKLRAAVQHHGQEFNAGHYSSFAWREDGVATPSWFLFDDTYVRQASWEEVAKAQAFMLLYEHSP